MCIKGTVMCIDLTEGYERKVTEEISRLWTCLVSFYGLVNSEINKVDKLLCGWLSPSTDSFTLKQQLINMVVVVYAVYFIRNGWDSVPYGFHRHWWLRLLHLLHPRSLCDMDDRQSSLTETVPRSNYREVVYRGYCIVKLIGLWGSLILLLPDRF